MIKGSLCTTREPSSAEMMRVLLLLVITTTHAFQDIITAVNRHPNVTWTAGLNTRFGGTPDAVKRLLGVTSDLHSAEQRQRHMHVPQLALGQTLPKTFDGRQKFAGCVGPILDQGECGSCWAVAAAEAMSDRLCIHRGKQAGPYLQLAAMDLTSCDMRGENMGCLGGVPLPAWQYAVKASTGRCLR